MGIAVTKLSERNDAEKSVGVQWYQITIHDCKPRRVRSIRRSKSILPPWSGRGKVTGVPSTKFANVLMLGP